jgi:tetratricopeptide (TPR) repeat protein
MVLFIRANHLSADPPVDLTTSQDVYTDPPQYTSYARNYILYGSFNPLHDFRLIFFLKSATTLLALFIFKVFGVGYAQSNMVGLIFSFSTIILIYFILRKAAGNVAALIYLTLISVDYNQVFYGRLPFLENSMNFFGILGITILVYSRALWSAALAGIFLGGAIFFSKLIGVVYLFPFVCYAIYEFFYDYRDEPAKFIRRYLLFAIGLIFVAVFWYFFSYRLLAESVSGYVEEQAVDLYGSPMALQSFWIFFYRYLSFGLKSQLFSRMPVVALLAWGMLLMFFCRAFRKDNWREGLLGINPGVLFLIALIIGAYGGLMIWNYRPLRYQTIMICPIYALAAVFLASQLQKVKPQSNLHWSFPIFLFLLLMIPLFQLTKSYFDFSESSFYLSLQPMIFLGMALALTAIILIAKQYLIPAGFSLPIMLKQGLIIIAIILAITPNIYKYWDWSGRATFTTAANSLDLAKILSPEAVVSGPYAADLSQENILQNLIHMFGVANVDTAFFRKYPITHLLLDKSNEEYAKKHYPEIMDSAYYITHYYVGGRKVFLCRVAGITGNLKANQYQLSPFELAIGHYFNQKPDSGNYYMKNFQRKNPQNLSANFISGNMAFDLKFYDEAELFYKRAIEYSPTDFHLLYKLGESYIRISKMAGNADYRDKAMEQFKLAGKYYPSSDLLRENIDSLLNAREVSDFE